MDLRSKKIYIAGATGMVGSAIKRKLESKSYKNLICKTSDELNLINQSEVDDFFFNEKPEIVILSAAKVGGIMANNNYRAEFIYNNLMIEANVIQASYKYQIEKLLFLGSSCIYPKSAAQPIKEEDLLSGYLEYTNEPYAIAKIAGIKLCESYYRQYDCNFLSVTPTNIYGENDSFDLQNCHVIPALIRKFHEAKRYNKEKVVLWGTGAARREFLYVDDLAEAIIFLLENTNVTDFFRQGISHLNIGTGRDIRVDELARVISEIVGFDGQINYDTSKPDGMMRKLLDVSRLSEMGWTSETSLRDGLGKTYDWFLETIAAEQVY